MNIRVSDILNELNRQGCQYLLIGGMNFMLRHEPKLTFDVDVWIEDSPENRSRCEAALNALDAEWGESDESWGPVSRLAPGWLDQQFVFSLLTPFGALDIFRSVQGLPDWKACWKRGFPGNTTEKTSYRGLSDDDMLQCQLALAAGEQKVERMQILRKAIAEQRSSDD